MNPENVNTENVNPENVNPELCESGQYPNLVFKLILLFNFFGILFYKLNFSLLFSDPTSLINK